jgi:uncharacterized repeat protein (TIGR03833 family)
MHNRGGGNHRALIRPGLCVDIIRKEDQRTGKLTRGRVSEVLTRSLSHPHGIKVRLEDGRVGRVVAVIDREPDGPDGKQARIPEDPAGPGVTRTGP